MTGDFGEDFKDRLRGVCEETVFPHVLASPEREVGGFLIGIRTSEETGSLPYVSSALRAVGANEQRSSLTFTHETWETAHAEIEALRERDEQTYEIVGWYHSHPNQGIFLSGMDLFIHHNFFSDPQQFAVVVDPLRHASGVFVWREDEVVPLYEEPMSI